MAVDPVTKQFMENQREQNRRIDEKLDKIEDKTDDIRTAIASLVTSVGAIKEDLSDVKVEKKKQNGRIGKLENWRSYITGGLVMLTFAWAAFQFVVPYLQRYNEVTVTNKAYEEIITALENQN